MSFLTSWDFFLSWTQLCGFWGDWFVDRQCLCRVPLWEGPTRSTPVHAVGFQGLPTLLIRLEWPGPCSRSPVSKGREGLEPDPWLSLLSFWAQPVHLCGSHLRSSLLPVPRAGSVDTPRTQGSSGKGTDPSQVQGLPMAMAGSTQTPSKPMITVCQRVSDSCPWAGGVCLATFSVCFLLTDENSSRAFYN